MVLCPPCSWSNWNLEMLVFEERGKLEYPEKNLSEQRREPTTNSTHMWGRRRDLNPGHIGGRQALSPLSPTKWTYPTTMQECFNMLYNCPWKQDENYWNDNNIGSSHSGNRSIRFGNILLENVARSFRLAIKKFNNLLRNRKQFARQKVYSVNWYLVIRLSHKLGLI